MFSSNNEKGSGMLLMLFTGAILLSLLAFGYRPVLERYQTLRYMRSALSREASLEIDTLVRANASLERLPNWAQLQQYPELPCPRWSANRKLSTLLSSRSCDTKLLKIVSSAFVPGNLLADELIIAPGSNEDFRLAVTGSIHIGDVLLIDNSRAASMEIIAGGSITIEKLSIQQDTPNFLSIESRRGEISLSLLPSNISLCDTQAAPNIMKLFLSAESGISLAALRLDGPRRIGCPPPRDPYYWPRRLLLGIHQRREATDGS